MDFITYQFCAAIVLPWMLLIPHSIIRTYPFLCTFFHSTLPLSKPLDQSRQSIRISFNLSLFGLLELNLIEVVLFTFIYSL